MVDPVLRFGVCKGYISGGPVKAEPQQVALDVFQQCIMAGQHTPMKGTPMTNKAFIMGY